ncbi:MAG: hypothetical protein EBU74_00540 [Betaproteobacteria bacterium]|nr:hypothetical protein [Betaproteobacteria bacterium]
MKRIRIALLMAGLCWIIGLSPLGDAWQVMVMPQLEWTKTEGASPSLTPAEMVMEFFVNGWHLGIGFLQDLSWITEGRALLLIQNGVALGAVLNAFAILCGAAALLFSLRSERPVARPSSASALREVGVGLSQAQFSVTNMLLDSRSQPVAEPLRNLQQQLQSISESVQSMNEKR